MARGGNNSNNSNNSESNSNNSESSSSSSNNSSSTISHLETTGIRLTDGRLLPADDIVFATGYQNMRTQTRALFGPAVADRTRDVWGFDAEGEIRSLARPSGHPRFWYMAGNLALCRWFSRPLALQIKAIEEGLCLAAAVG
jgi:hypothetical protein